MGYPLIIALSGCPPQAGSHTLNTSPALSAGLTTGLTQVLSDGTHTYLYGNTRLAQQGVSGTEYFLTDALGSVRQLANASGTVTLSQAYQPYGETMNTTGNGASPYGFTGEYTDSQTGLQYLRARYYVPGVGRFLTKDWICS